MRKNSLKIFDICLIALTLCAAFFFILRSGEKVGGSAFLLVSNGESDWIFPLEKDREFSIAGEIGETKIAVKSGKASVLDSPCPNKTCVSSAPISKIGEWIICLPNKVSLIVSEE